MNSYFLSVLSATSYGRFPELCDSWRTFHAYAVMSDSEIHDLNDKQEYPRGNAE